MHMDWQRISFSSREETKMPKPQKRPQKPTGPKKPSFSDFYRQFVRKTDPTEQESFRAMQKRQELGIDELIVDEREMRRRWNQYAPSENNLLPVSALSVFNDYIFRNARLKGNETVLSVGSGGAALETFLAKHRLPKGKVIAVDISDEMNKRALDLKSRSQTPNIHAVTGSALNLPIAEKSADLVVLNNLSVLPENKYPKMVSSIRRAIKPNAESKVLMVAGYPTMQVLANTRRYWEQGGFKIADEKVVRLGFLWIAYWTMHPK